MLSAIVMAAGKGTRMVSSHAKTMHKVLDKPMIEHVNDTLDKLKVDNKVFVVGHDAESIKKHLGDKVHYAIQNPQLGTAHAAMQAKELEGYEGKTLIVNGDCPLITVETYNSMIEKANEYPLVVLTTILENPASYGRIVRDGDKVVKIVEKKDASEEELLIKEVNAGIYCVDNELLWKYLPEVKDNNKAHEFYITDLVEIFQSHGHDVSAVVGDNQELQGINSREELVKATKYLQRKINRYWMSRGVSIYDPESTYIGTDVEISEDTVIYPNVRIEGRSIIGKDNVIEEGSYLCNAIVGDNNHIIASRITDSKLGSNINLGPNAHLRNGCHIYDDCRIGNYVEMKNTSFGKGSKCAHLTYVGDASVGENCNFGCGVVTVNYDGKNKFHTEIGNHVFVGSNVNIIAPVTIEDNTVLAAGSTITASVSEGDMAIARVRQEVKVGYGFKYLNK